ncbi:peptidase [Sulfurifustis variabilis]|uniref:Peptidase n=2 Tax=Sulfurifustis variabilis TaxID=1675686 RepID=A0A1B4VD24_9GAMM|nr:peptidase [Sulfurifustis variabilis]
MTPLKLYLLRAVYDWSVEQGCTPHVIVDAKGAGVQVPPAYVHDGQIVLNIHPRAVGRFELTERALSFSARFGGRPFDVEAPLAAIRAVYAKENGQGIAFPESEEPGPPEPEHAAESRPRPVLKRVK